MNADIGKILAVAIPVCLSATATFIAIAFRIIGTKSRKILPACKEWFERTENEIKEMKKASTDRMKTYAIIQAQLEVTLKSQEKTEADIKGLADLVQKQQIAFAEFNLKLIHIADDIEAILKGIEKRKSEKNE